MASRSAPGKKCPQCLKLTGRPITSLNSAARLVYYRCDECPRVWIENKRDAEPSSEPSPLMAYSFALRSRERGQLVGQAVVCAEAKYASVMRTTSPYPTRRVPNGAQWAAMARELRDSRPLTPLTQTSALSQVLTGELAVDVSVHYVSHEQLPEDIAGARLLEALDQRLLTIREPGAGPR